MKFSKTLGTKLLAVGLGMVMTLGVGLTASRVADEAQAASPVTVDGTYFTTTDQTQTATIDGVTIGGFLKQYQTTKLWLTSGTGYIYNSTDLGSITKLTLSYNTGGSASANQRFNFGTSAMASYLSTGGTTRSVSTGGTSYVETGGVGKGFFNISVSSKNLQLVTLVIEYSGSSVPTYAVSFDSAGGTPAPTSLTVSQNGTFTFPSPGTKSGYVFDGWSSDGGTTKYATGVTSPAVTGVITYTAFWSATPVLQSIAITGSLSKTAYFTNDSWSPAGLTVTGTYSSGPTQDVTSQVTWSYNPTAPNNVSITSVTVTATFGGQTDSEDVTGITVSEKVSTVVISEVYGAGGNNGATYKYDFVELYNNSNSTIDLAGWSLFYGSATGVFSRNNNAYTDLSGKILPKSYLLVRQAAGNGGAEHPVLPDIQGTIALGANNFKLALTNSADIPTDYDSANVIDFIGAGTATKFEGTVAPAAALNDSISRTLVGDIYVDTDDNGNDFTLNTGITPMNAAVSVAGRIMAYEGGDLITAECATKYSTIKAQMLLLSSGSLTYFQNSTALEDARLRYVAWSVANGDNTPYSAGSYPATTIESAYSKKSLIFASVIGIIGLSTVAGFYFLRKKKETF